MTNYITGDRALLKKLKALDKKNAKKAVTKGTRAGCKIVLAKAKGYISVKTGALRQNLKVKAMKRSRTAFGTRVTIGDSGFFKGKFFYGGFLEFGHHVGKRNPVSANAKPRRFIRGKHQLQNAAQDAAPQALKVALDVIQQEVFNCLKQV